MGLAHVAGADRPHRERHGVTLPFRARDGPPGACTAVIIITEFEEVDMAAKIKSINSTAAPNPKSKTSTGRKAAAATKRQAQPLPMSAEIKLGPSEAFADDLDLRDAELEHRFDLWKADVTTARVLGAKTRTTDITEALHWAEHRRDQEAIAILGMKPETDSGSQMWSAVLLSSAITAIEKLKPEDWDVEAAVLEFLRNRLAQLEF